MDRERLKEVHQTDLTESRINEEFVDWLRTKGVSWLLVVLLALCGYLLVVRWRQHQSNYREEAWMAFLETEQSGLPSSYEDVAEEYGDIASIAPLSRLRAASRLLLAVQMNRALAGGDSTEPAPTLIESERTEYLDRADRLFQRVIDADDQSLAMTLLTVNAMNGRAAVAAARGDLDQAAQLYVQAAERAEPAYPGLANQSRNRATAVAGLPAQVTLPPSASVSTPTPGSLKPPTIDSMLRELLMPQQSDAS